MIGKKWCGQRKRLAAVVAIMPVLLGGGVARAQVQAYKPGEYPAPKTPSFRLDVPVEELLPIARVVARKPAVRQPLVPGYGIKPGQRVLIVVASNFDDRVLEAIRRAIEEVGGQPDIMKTWAPEQSPMIGNQGHQEVRQLAAIGTPSLPRFGFPKAVREAGGASPAGTYDLVINGSGGPAPLEEYGWEYIPWDTVDKFMFGMAGFPFELQRAIDVKQWNLLLSSSKVHATDPEGTDMTWNWKPHYQAMLHEEWPQWKSGEYAVVLGSHLGTFPEFLSPADAEANGTIGGTMNHTGTFPNMLITVRNNEIVKIEGGAEYAEKWRQMLEACRGIQFPGFPGPGCGWLEEAALGNDVWRARDLNFAGGDFTGRPGWERGRAGIIHWGLGVSRNVDAAPAVAEWLEEHKPPSGGGHWHVHTNFNTIDLTIAGKQVRLVDKGHLTMLDDPEIRQIAAKYGNPDELLREKWIPAVPGINVAGNYQTDYAPDPYKVISAQQAEVHKRISSARSEP